jgi:hypothetical protein
VGSKNFTYTGRWQRFSVPHGVEYITVTLLGAGSGSVRGGQVTGRLKVKGIGTLWVGVGGRGNAGSGTRGGVPGFGAGGPGGGGAHPGASGGGATSIRSGTTTGPVRAVAGGAGGTSGDGGKGGQGGNSVGENGWTPFTGPDNPGDGSEGHATGGTQDQGGFGGQSGLAALPDGSSAILAILGAAGAGGSATGANSYGGGGGGGGYRSGGGGQSGLLDTAPGGGGAGGSNYSGDLINATNSRGEGALGNGSVTFSWVEPPPANQPPSPPTQVKIVGIDATAEMATRSMGQVSITARVSDPEGKRTRLVARLSTSRDFTVGVHTLVGSSVASGQRSTVTFTGLARNTLYYGRLYSRDDRGHTSTNYAAISFWTNRNPEAPTLISPADGTTISSVSSVTFDWQHNDLDEGSPTQRGWQLRWRHARTALSAAGAWTTVAASDAVTSHVLPSGTFTPNRNYEWQVRTQDPQGLWGEWAVPQTFFISGTTLSPLPLAPSLSEAVNTDDLVPFSWLFRSPSSGDSQVTADVRYRVIGADDWITVVGDLTTPGSFPGRDIPDGSLIPGHHYEWQVRTKATVGSLVSDWSESADFWTVSTPGLGTSPASALSDYEDLSGVLGQGENRAFVYSKGGQFSLGEITNTTMVRWDRRRDDISEATVTVTNLDADTTALLSQVHTWMHELVIFRNDVRVWEGPITLIEDDPSGVATIQAKDVMAWVYRRIMRQGYNDSYRVVNGVELGAFSVVQRAAQIILNGLAPDDPNILRYLTTFNFPDDAGESRVVPVFSRTAWEEVDDMAATAGLDYTTVGRRIVLWDTHRAIGRLPEMRSSHFSSPPIVSEYGMQLATAFGVTNNNGIYGLTEKPPSDYGLVEQLASAYGETDGGTTDVLTPAARLSLEQNLTSQAVRNIGGRWPAPVVVRVPDNSTLQPDTPVAINSLVPGVWIPLRAATRIRNIAQWQKLDSMTCTQTSEAEQITVVMSPAPNGGQDPDADSTLSQEE